MIDTLQFQLHSEQYDQSTMLQMFQSTQLQYKKTTTYKDNNAVSHHATYQNWNFNLSNSSLKGIGSLTKLQNGNNIGNSSFEHVKGALDRLQSLFNIPIGEAVIKRIDVGYNIPTNNPVSQYLKLLVEPIKFKRVLYPNETVYFSGKTHNLVFYDKIAEAIAKHEVPKAMKDIHLLRYEMRLTTPAKIQQAGFPELRIKNLYDEGVYQKLLSEWYKQYLLVPKISLLDLPPVNFRGVRLFKDSMTLYAIHHMGGFDKVRSMLVQSGIKGKPLSDLKKAIEELNTVRQFSPVLKAELDDKIAAVYYSILKN